jgi:murein DD-endopeptidase MepM/ murein hydrolase activator NlpD
VERSGFTRFFVLQNGHSAEDFARWVFFPEMMQGAVRKWWGDRGKRATPHEGIDFCLFTDARGGHHHLTEKSRVPAMYAGSVVSIIPDFLGQTVIVEVPAGACTLLTIYGHINPAENIKMGARVVEGSVVGTVSTRETGTSGLLPHVHLTVATVDGPLIYDSLDWDKIANSPFLTLMDPLGLIDGPWSIADQGIVAVGTGQEP